MKTIEQNDQVTLHYTGTLSTGEQFDSSVGKEPLTFEVGGGQVIPGFETAVVGMKVDETKKFTITSDQAYGEMNEELIYKIDRNTIPDTIQPEAGMRLVSNLEDGRQIPVTITDVTPETITLDANHPLAGKDLTFDIKIVGVN
jgi:FKBP-type peptidyl-prolyl cis-trans isomerase 2